MNVSSNSNIASASPHSRAISTSQCLTMNSMPSLLESAAEKFILNKDFENVFETCDRALQTLTNGEHEDERSEDIKTGFCILGMQALAELNEWRRALPWVLQQYDYQEKIPAKIIQMCILLYSKVGEAVVMMEVTNIWLHCVENNRASGFATVMELYLLHILIPLGHLEEARELIQGRVGSNTLTEEQRRTALDIVEEKELECNPAQNPSSDSTTCLLTIKPQGAILHKLGAIIKHLCKKLLGPFSCTFHLHKVLVLAVFLYMFFIRMDPALPSSFMWISKLHQLIKQMWTAWFGPYYHAMK
ncbi:peroxisome assembly protein 26 isoform X2 [Boleophthalmus pectinirostris]|uniref:peroxisome assembly protein 26 isoform X2 n=1 Tax=Boleophthalmus pectinirostris TaxID=150288 RepID=UPI000A1C53EA|nr:peroxisome assembly protein 26 isoform X2 [Boleophthalmus pectinirostris]